MFGVRLLRLFVFDGLNFIVVWYCDGDGVLLVSIGWFKCVIVCCIVFRLVIKVVGLIVLDLWCYGWSRCNVIDSFFIREVGWWND